MFVAGTGRASLLGPRLDPDSMSPRAIGTCSSGSCHLQCRNCGAAMFEGPSPLESQSIDHCAYVLARFIVKGMYFVRPLSTGLPSHPARGGSCPHELRSKEVLWLDHAAQMKLSGLVYLAATPFHRSISAAKAVAQAQIPAGPV